MKVIDVGSDTDHILEIMMHLPVDVDIVSVLIDGSTDFFTHSKVNSIINLDNAFRMYGRSFRVNVIHFSSEVMAVRALPSQYDLLNYVDGISNVRGYGVCQLPLV